MEQRGTSTVVGVFDDYPTAERVIRDLTSNGIPRNAIDINSNYMSESAGSTKGSTREREGGISGFFSRLFGTEEESGHYAEAVRRGSAVVTVTATEDQLDRAIEIMNQHGAIDIDRRISEYQQTGYERFNPDAPPYSSEEAARERERFRASEKDRVIPVVNEELEIGKRTIRRGGVRVVSHVVERPVEERVRLREEKVTVERHKVDKPISAAEASAIRDESIEVEEISEEPVVSKRARVKEEIVVGKESTERTEQVRDTVRHTEVNVENLERTAGTDYTQDFRRHYESNFANSGLNWDTVDPAYRYGYKMGADPRYKGRSWSDVETTLRSDYQRQYPESTWEKIKNAVRYGWERVTR